MALVVLQGIYDHCDFDNEMFQGIYDHCDFDIKMFQGIWSL